MRSRLRVLPTQTSNSERLCLWCGAPSPPTRRGPWCSKLCRERIWRSNNREKVRENSRRQRARRGDPKEFYRTKQKIYSRRWYVKHHGISDEVGNPKDRFRAAKALGYRSGLEVSNSKRLDALGARYKYEPFAIPFTQPAKKRRYTPDFVLDNGVVVELKGEWKTADRQKHLMIREQHPDLEIRIVFSRSSTRISKQSKTTYAMWCNTHGITFADREIPESWIAEAPHKKSLAAIAAITGAKKK